MKATYYSYCGTQVTIEKVEKLDLKELQVMVGGLIQEIIVESKINGKKKRRSFILNEKGVLKNLHENPFSKEITLDSIWKDTIFLGNIIVCEGILK